MRVLWWSRGWLLGYSDLSCRHALSPGRFFSRYIYNKRRGRICLPRRNFPSEIAAVLSVKTGDRLSKPYRQWWKFTLQQKSASCFSAGCAQNRLWTFSGKWDKFGTFCPKIACFFAVLYRSYDIKLVDGLHRRELFCGSFILDQAGVNTIKFSIFQLSPILHIFALLWVTLRANDVKYDVNDVGR